MMKKWLSSGEQIHIPNDEDADLLMWIELIVTKGIPLESVRDETMRKYLGKKAYAFETVRDVLLATQFLVEKAIAAEMKEAGVGAIVHMDEQSTQHTPMEEEMKEHLTAT